jgi:hypothetical protein
MAPKVDSFPDFSNSMPQTVSGLSAPKGDPKMKRTRPYRKRQSDTRLPASRQRSPYEPGAVREVMPV